METTLNFERVILVKELNEKFKKVGDVFEVANVFENSFLLRDGRTRMAVGVVSFEDFERCFVHEGNYNNKWTNWTLFTGFDGQNDCMYRTNGKKVQCRFLTDKVRAEAACNVMDDFNLFFGIQLAYLRCLNKALANKKIRLETELNQINIDIVDNERIMKKMINSLDK